MRSGPARTRPWLRPVAALTVALLALGACSGPGPPAAPPTDAPAGADGRTLVGYLAGWRVGEYPVKAVQTSGAAARLTHLVYAFGDVRDGRCAADDAYGDREKPYSAADSVDGVADDPTDEASLRGTFGQLRRLKAGNPGLKVLWSFGGWHGSQGFTRAARDPVGFAESCRRLVEDPRWADVFDGIDIDWEYPNACGLTCDRSGPDALRRLTGALRTTFGAAGVVTAAITADSADGGRLAAADYAGAARALDWVMVMTYDFAVASGPGRTAVHSALTAHAGAAGADADAAISALKLAGIPARKLLLGLGFYGRGWTGVTESAPGGKASGAAPGPDEAGLEDYRSLVRRCPPTGTVGGTAYAFCGGQWWSYDTPATVGAKMAYARAEGLGGGFVWELAGDTAAGDLLAAARSGLR